MTYYDIVSSGTFNPKHLLTHSNNANLNLNVNPFSPTLFVIVAKRVY